MPKSNGPTSTHQAQGEPLYTLSPIAMVESCFKEKFGVPRQPGLATEAKALIRLLPPYDKPEAVEGLSQASHLWLQFIFHCTPEDQTSPTGWKPKVRPPRLGGNEKLGVFATRSPVRPNRLGLSVVKLDAIDLSHGVILQVSGVDLVDGTPVVDIKPYVPYVDAIPDATNGFAKAEPVCIPVVFSDSAKAQLVDMAARHPMDVKKLIEQVLEQDPRPPYQTIDPARTYGMQLLDFDVRWRYEWVDEVAQAFRIVVQECVV